MAAIGGGAQERAGGRGARGAGCPPRGRPRALRPTRGRGCVARRPLSRLFSCSPAWTAGLVHASEGRLARLGDPLLGAFAASGRAAPFPIRWGLGSARGPRARRWVPGRLAAAEVCCRLNSKLLGCERLGMQCACNRTQSTHQLGDPLLVPPTTSASWQFASAHQHNEQLSRNPHPFPIQRSLPFVMRLTQGSPAGRGGTEAAQTFTANCAPPPFLISLIDQLDPVLGNRTLATQGTTLGNPSSLGAGQLGA